LAGIGRADAGDRILPIKAVVWDAELGVTILVLAAIAVGAWLRVHGALTAREVADVAVYRVHVEVLLAGGSVYRQLHIYPYFPGWLDLEWANWALSRFLVAPFWLTIRGMIIAADVLTCFAIWWAGTILHGPGRGRWAATIYALSPIAVIVSGYHGQFDAIPTLLTVLALGLATRRASPIVGALIGLAIAVKPYPAALAPAFLRVANLTWRQRVGLASLIGVVLGAVVVVSSGVETPLAVSSVLRYIGTPDQGLGGLLRGYWSTRTGDLSPPADIGNTFSQYTRWLALALMALSWLLTFRRAIARSCAAILLAFLVAYSGISTQYLLWPLAWLLLSDVPLRWSIAYSVGVSVGAVTFYLVYWPAIILGSAGQGGPWPQFIPLYDAGEVVSWLTIATVYCVTMGQPRLPGRWFRPIPTRGSSTGAS
jgi:hypothetical protein